MRVGPTEVFAITQEPNRSVISYGKIDEFIINLGRRDLIEERGLSGAHTR